MMLTRKRITFQLTPLLDLLLIVIFAQYMEVQQTADAERQQVEQAREEIEQDRLQFEAEYQAKVRELEASADSRQSETDRLREEYERRTGELLQQHERAGETLANAFNLPVELVSQLAQLRTDGNPSDAELLSAAAERVGQLLQARGGEFLEFVVRLDEMQKHVTLWEIHLQDNGKAALTDGEQSQVVDFETEDELISGVYEASKSLTEPRTLVIVLLSWGDTQFGLRRRATDAMPRLMERLRTDAAGTRWYDFSLMGFRPAGPVFSKRGHSTLIEK